MKIEITHTPTDLYQAHQLNYFNSKARFASYSAGVFVSLLFISGILDRSIFGIIFNGFWICVTLGYPYTVLKLHAYYIFKKTPVWKLPRTVELEEDGIKSSTSMSTSMLKWDLIIRARYNKKVVLLYPQPNAYIILPRRVMSKENWEQLLDMVSNRFETPKTQPITLH